MTADVFAKYKNPNDPDLYINVDRAPVAHDVSRPAARDVTTPEEPVEGFVTHDRVTGEQKVVPYAPPWMAQAPAPKPIPLADINKGVSWKVASVASMLPPTWPKDWIHQLGLPAEEVHALALDHVKQQQYIAVSPEDWETTKAQWAAYNQHTDAGKVAGLVKGLRQRDEAKRLYEAEQRAAAAEVIELSDGGYQDPAGRLDWGSFLSTDLGQVEWIAQPLLAKGQQAALVAEGKAGKSLLCLEWACALAAGRPFIGNPARDPMTVLYIDLENGHDEIQRRVRALGYDQPELLERLAYLSFPAEARPLDTPEGAAWLLGAVDRYKPELVFLDTISRLIQGAENDADTWLNLYRLSLVPLKRRKIATVRLDHLGKDESRGSRGSSAKSQDVDAVWELTKGSGDQIRLARTHTRSGLGADRLVLRRLGGPGQAGTTRHVPAGAADGGPTSFVPVEVEKLAALLDGAGVPVSAGKIKINEALSGLQGRGVKNELAQQVANYRKQRGDNPRLQGWSGTTAAPEDQPGLWDHPGPDGSPPKSERSRTTSGPLGPPNWSPVPTPGVGTREPGSPGTGGECVQCGTQTHYTSGGEHRCPDC